MTNPSEDLPTPNPVGPALGGRPVDTEAEPAPPVDVETDESRASRDARGTGQQLEAGEG